MRLLIAKQKLTIMITGNKTDQIFFNILITNSSSGVLNQDGL